MNANGEELSAPDEVDEPEVEGVVAGADAGCEGCDEGLLGAAFAVLCEAEAAEEGVLADAGDDASAGLLCAAGDCLLNGGGSGCVLGLVAAGEGFGDAVGVAENGRLA